MANCQKCDALVLHVDTLTEDCSKLREALEFYAKHENWSYYPHRGEEFTRSEVGNDWGLKARAALPTPEPADA